MSGTELFWGFFGLAVWFAVPAICLYFAIDGLRSGIVRVKLGSYSRTNNPGWFWACIAMYSGVAGFALYLTGLIAADALREGWGW